MVEMSSTIRELLVKAAEKYGPQDAIRYKVKREGKTASGRLLWRQRPTVS